MWSTLCRGPVLLASVVIATVAAQPVPAQHHHGGHHGGGHYGGGHHGGGHYGGGHSHIGGIHVGGHHGGVHIGLGHGHLAGGHHVGHHGSWQHFLPSVHHHHVGAYYSYGGANYYTPAQVYRPVFVSPQLTESAVIPANVLPTVASTPPRLEQNPIAPQSVKLEFGGFQRTGDLADRLAIETNRWCLDMHYNYQNNADFAATYREAYGLLQLANSMHAADKVRERESISRQASQFERSFHDLQDKVKSWTREERRAVGGGGINDKSETVESILHHLIFDVGVKMEHGAEREEQAPAPAAETPEPLPLP